MATKKANSTRGKKLKTAKKLEQQKPLSASDFSITMRQDTSSPK